jgi:hypothetical protein
MIRSADESDPLWGQKKQGFVFATRFKFKNPNKRLKRTQFRVRGKKSKATR